MIRRMMNVRAYVTAAEDSADFWLNFQAVNDRFAPIAELGQVHVTDSRPAEEVIEKIKVILQSYRMGARYGKEVGP